MSEKDWYARIVGSGLSNLYSASIGAQTAGQLTTAAIQGYQQQFNQHLQNQLTQQYITARKTGKTDMAAAIYGDYNTYRSSASYAEQYAKAWVAERWPGMRMSTHYDALEACTVVVIQDGYSNASNIRVVDALMGQAHNRYELLRYEIDTHMRRLWEKGELVAADYSAGPDGVWYNATNCTMTGSWNVDKDITLVNGDTFELTWKYNPDTYEWTTQEESDKVEIKLTLKEAKYLEEACESDETLKAILAKIEEEVDFQIVVSFRKDDA